MTIFLDHFKSLDHHFVAKCLLMLDARKEHVLVLEAFFVCASTDGLPSDPEQRGLLVVGWLLVDHVNIKAFVCFCLLFLLAAVRCWRSSGFRPKQKPWRGTRRSRCTGRGGEGTGGGGGGGETRETRRWRNTSSADTALCGPPCVSCVCHATITPAVTTYFWKCYSLCFCSCWKVNK